MAAQSKPLSAAELAFYQGTDREKILVEGAQKEGQVTFYTSNTWVAGPVSQEFGKKYPFVKANVWRSDSKALLKRLTEEVAAGRFHCRCRRNQSRVRGDPGTKQHAPRVSLAGAQRLRRRCKN